MSELPPAEAPRRRRLLTRRKLLSLGVGSALAGAAAWRLIHVDRPTPLRGATLSAAAEALLAEAWKGLEPAKVVDVHSHVLGLGVGGNGCYVHADTVGWTSPVRRFKARIYKGAAGIWDDENADALFVERLVDLVENQQPHPRLVLLAFDQHHDAEGNPVRERTEFHVPNEYVAGIAAKRPDLFLFGCSVHPYRKDALEALERCKESGARLVKWLPNAMGIDPMDPRCDAYYEKLAALELPLLTHAGEEQAVHAEEAQELGNPLRLRRPLERGATVIAAHCASLGSSQDLDQPAAADGTRPRVASYALWRRLMAEPKWDGKLFGDISATTQFNRVEAVVADLLTTPSLHGRILNGSDYPLPAIDPLVRTGMLVDLGLLDPAERPLINEVFALNPLQFDFLVKRRLRVVKDGVEHRYANAVFETGRVLGLG